MAMSAPYTTTVILRMGRVGQTLDIQLFAKMASNQGMEAIYS